MPSFRILKVVVIALYFCDCDFSSLLRLEYRDYITLGSSFYPRA